MLDMIASGLTALTSARDIAKSIAGLKQDVAVQTKASELLSVIADAQSSLIEAQATILQLQNDLRDTTDKLSRRGEFERRFAKYRAVTPYPGCLLYQPIGVDADLPQHYICPKCVEDHQIYALQLHSDRLRQLEYFCPSCKNTYLAEENPHYEERRTKALPDARFPRT